MIRFDTDVEVENVQTGANNVGRVPTRDIVGYVQLQPSGVPLTPGQLDDLTAAQGPAGGAINCVLTIGASPLQMRTGSFAANRTATGGGSPQLAVAARGSVILPQTGQWSFTYRLSSETEPHGLDPNAAIPLIRQNPIGGIGQAYLFADPVDLFQPVTPAGEYGILQSSDTQRLLVRAPKIQPGQTAITSVNPFLLADVYALAGGVALFPREDLCTPLPANCSLQAPAAAQLRLVIPSASRCASGQLHRRITRRAHRHQCEFVTYGSRGLRRRNGGKDGCHLENRFSSNSGLVVLDGTGQCARRPWVVRGPYSGGRGAFRGERQRAAAGQSAPSFRRRAISGSGHHQHPHRHRHSNRAFVRTHEQHEKDSVRSDSPPSLRCSRSQAVAWKKDTSISGPEN